MKRRTLIITATMLVAGTGLLAADENTLRVYYGTKNQSGSKGIYTGTLDLKTGKLSEPQLAAEAENPGFIAISQSERFLYAVASGKGGQKIGRATPLAEAVKWKEDLEVERLMNREDIKKPFQLLDDE